MASNGSGQQIPCHKNRRVWLSVIGVVEIAIGCLMLLSIVAMQRAPVPPEESGLQLPVSPVAMKFVTTIVNGSIALLFLAIGVGSIQCRNWARLAMLGLSGFWLVSGLFTTLILSLMTPTIQQQTDAPPEVVQTVFGLSLALELFAFVLMPTVFLIFYSSKSVKATCLAMTPQTAARTAGFNVPAPLIALAVSEGLGGFAILSFMIVPATAVFGVVVHGLPAFLVLLAFSLASGFAAVLIVYRKFSGWVLALVKNAVAMVSWVITVAGRDVNQFYRELGVNERQLPGLQSFPQMQSLTWYLSVPAMVAYVIYIWYAKKYFPRESWASPDRTGN